MALMWQQQHCAWPALASSPVEMTMAADALSVMLERESAAYSCRDYRDGAVFDEHDRERRDDKNDCCTTVPLGAALRWIKKRVTPDDRARIVGWCYNIVEQSNTARETIAVAMSLVDRYMSLSLPGRSCLNPRESQSHLSQDVQDILHSRVQHQLVSLTALYIATKLGKRVGFSSEDFSLSSLGTYSKEDTGDTERRMLHAVGWRVYVPTPFPFRCLILELMSRIPREDNTKTWIVGQGIPGFLHNKLALQTELAVLKYELTPRHCSTIADASILNAIEQVNDDDYELLMKGVLRVLRKFDIECPMVLLDIRDRLWALSKEDLADGVADDVISTLDVMEVARQGA